MDEKCFYTGEDYGDIIPSINPDIIGTFPINMGASFFIKTCSLDFKSISGYLNHQLVLMNLHGYLLILNINIKDVYDEFKKFKTNLIANNFQEHNIKKQTIIHLMKKIIDEIIILYCIKLDHNNILKDKKIKITSIGDLKKNSQLTDNIKNELNYNQFVYLFNTINDLHNAFKHDIMINESSMLAGAGENPTIVALYAPYGKLLETVFLNSNFTQIIMGFNDFIEDFLKLKSCVKKHTINTYPVTGSG